MKQTVNKTHAVIFDMDGVLIDSEPIWAQVERKVFSSLGVKMSEEHIQVTSRLTTREVTEFWHHLHPWSHPPLEVVEQSVIEEVGDWILTHGEPMTGVLETLKRFQNADYLIGLATNSPLQIVEKVLQKLRIAHFFDAISSCNEVKKGKPDPEIYTLTRQKLGVTANQCLVFEDSITGLKAAKAAGMNTVWIHEEISRKDSIYADFKLQNFDQLSVLQLDIPLKKQS